jgi:hypothetical protein
LQQFLGAYRRIADAPDLHRGGQRTQVGGFPDGAAADARANALAINRLSPAPATSRGAVLSASSRSVSSAARFVGRKNEQSFLAQFQQ